MSPSKTKATKLLVINRQAGTMNDQIEAKLRADYADHAIVEFDPKTDVKKLIAPRAPVIVAGGDGTVEFFVRELADTEHPLGIVSLGTFNNFARALGLPTDLDQAIAVTKDGHARPITLGRVNRHFFVEACAIGLFGETIAMGDSAKDLVFGAFARKLKNVIAAKAFQYELTGDLEGSGSAMSLVFTNTSSIGGNLSVGESNPINPYLEFSVQAGRTRTDIVARALASALQLKRDEAGSDQIFRFQRVEVKTRPRVRVYADNVFVGRTPATITAEVSALKVLLPA